MSKDESILAFTTQSIRNAFPKHTAFPTAGVRLCQLSNVWFQNYVNDIWPEHTHVGVRKDLETDTNFMHPIPYTIVMHEDRVAVYRRSKKVGEQRLAGNVSIGFGGHVTCSPENRPMTSTELLDMLVDCRARELEEELGLEEGRDYMWSSFADEDGGNPFTHTIIDFTNEVGRVHLGLLSIIELSSNLDPGVAGAMIKESLEDGLEWVGFLPVRGLSETLAPLSPENWTIMAAVALEELLAE